MKCDTWCVFVLLYDYFLYLSATTIGIWTAGTLEDSAMYQYIRDSTSWSVPDPAHLPLPEVWPQCPTDTALEHGMEL
jgi:hypothetical protein